MTRFHPVRAGIMALYEYDDVVFELSGGRMLLRGHNTSGKTKALELLLPFCLDGDISPRKLDPFARSAKEMKWNLLGHVERDKQIGYVWLEFERLGPAGVERLTCGVGMKATRGREGVTRWYFLIRDRRVGQEISLRRGDNPLPRSQLAEQLADGDELLGSPGEYRRALNRALYGFPSVDQYETMIGLLLELRRPHLSKSLDHAEVTRLLSASLPEVDHELMRRLGEGIEQLDQLQAALDRLEGVRELLDGFVASAYAPYARALTSDRGDRLRSANTGLNRASAERRRLAEQRDCAGAEAEVTVARLREAKQALDAATGEHAALLASREWASVAEVEQLGRTAGHAAVAADRAREHLESAAAALAVAEADVIAAGAAAAEASRARDSALDELAAEASAAGLERRHAVLVAALADSGRDPHAGAALLREEAAGRLEVLAAHRELRDVLASAAARAERAREEQEDAAARLRTVAERAAAASEELGVARERLAEEIGGWAAELRELAPSPEALERARALALDAGADGAAAPESALRETADARRDELVERRSLTLAGRRALAAERAVLEQRLGALRAERDEPPPAAHGRPAPREDRPGAPLWLLVDFRDGLGADERCGIEAALEGAGLLDAWVTPDGRALDPATLDAALVAAADDGTPGTAGRTLAAVDEGTPGTAGRTLAEALRPLDGRPVPVAVLKRLLGAVSLCERAPTVADGPAISTAGHYALGPLTGRFRKPHAEYVGAAARAERRARTIVALEAELAALAERDAGLERELTAADARLEALTAELGAFPDEDRVASARRAHDSLVRREREARRELGERERAAAEAAERRAAEAERCGEHAARHGLPAAIDEPGLRALEQATHRYGAAAAGVAAAVERAREAEGRHAQLEARLAEGRAGAGELRRAAEAAAAEARRLEAEHAEREAALGRSGDEIRERMRAVEARLRDLRADVERLHEDDKRGAIRVQAAEDALREAQAALARATDERDAALAGLRRLGPAGVLELALGEHAPPDLAQSPGWSLTRALEVLRAVPDGALRVRSSLLRLANSVQERAGELDRALGQQAEMSVVTEQTDDGVVLVKVREGAAERSVSELAVRLESEIADRERTLTAEQRRVFGDALLEEIAEHLRGRVDRVEAMVADMNATLASCPTGSGKTVQLEWRPREDDGGELRRVVRLLRRSVATLGEADRAALVAFFRARIQHARDEAAIAADSGAGAAAHLLDAFDYREWHEFGMFECRDGSRERLTRRRHALGSGGEQAVLIHMPLFAAAAALYSSSVDGRAPRLVMLDEALSGIDDDTRAKVMGVLVALDLDFVMTSHELWGTYRTVPQLSIYQLHRENGVFGVASERFLWDGDLLHELEQGSLLR